MLWPSLICPTFTRHFGAPDEWQALDRRRAIAGFAPGKLFAYVRWESGQFGTTSWTLTIGRTRQDGARLLPVPGIQPGINCLGLLYVKTFAKCGLKLIDEVEYWGFQPEDISPHWWRMACHRMRLNLPVRSYTLHQHDAFLKAKDLNV